MVICKSVVRFLNQSQKALAIVSFVWINLHIRLLQTVIKKQLRRGKKPKETSVLC